MSVLSIQELSAFGKKMQEFGIHPTAVGLEQLRHANQIAENYIAVIKSSEQSVGVASDATVSDLNNARDSIANVYESLCEQRKVTANSSQLSLLISQSATLHNNLNTLSWLVGESQADQDETLPGEFNSADDLFKAMGV